MTEQFGNEDAETKDEWNKKPHSSAKAPPTVARSVRSSGTRLGFPSTWAPRLTLISSRCLFLITRPQDASGQGTGLPSRKNWAEVRPGRAEEGREEMPRGVEGGVTKGAGRRETRK